MCQFALKEVNIKPSPHQKPEATEKASTKEWEAFMHILKLKESRIGGRELKHLVDVKAVFDKHYKRYFMIPWASGGSLKQLLMDEHQFDYQGPGELIQHAIKQLLGMCEALARLHVDNCRHGDLKPENILLFTDDRQPRLGTWKIADFGLAKFHFDPTARRGATSTMYGTISYEPPEFLDTINYRPISRLFDVWSMGCITLQLITWMLYGSEGVRALADRTWNRHREASTFWTEAQLADGAKGPQSIHIVVQTHMAAILDNPLRSPAIKDLASVVKDKLLVMLPRASRGQLPRVTRVDSNALVSALRAIRDRGVHNERYWYADGELFQEPTHLLSTAPRFWDQIQNEVGSP